MADAVAPVRFTVPHPEEGSPTGEVDEIAWRRELKQLRVRVAQLEAERGLRQDPSIKSERGGEHGIRCGMPCHVVVYDEQPRVECQVCGTRLDAIEVLRDYAHHERNFCYSLNHLRKESADLTAKVAKLKALCARLRGQARMVMPERPPHDGERKWDRDQWKNWLVDQILARIPDR